MKKNVIKTAVAAVCVVAAGMGGLKAYNVANHSQTNMLLAENVDALSAGDSADSNDSNDSSSSAPITGKEWIATGDKVTAYGVEGIVEECGWMYCARVNCIIGEKRYNFSPYE